MYFDSEDQLFLCFRMSVSTPLRFNILIANILVISESFPRLPKNVANSIPVLNSEAASSSELEKCQIILSLHLAMIVFELMGQMLGITFFQYIQSAISISKFVCYVTSVKVFRLSHYQLDPDLGLYCLPMAKLDPVYNSFRVLPTAIYRRSVAMGFYCLLQTLQIIFDNNFSIFSIFFVVQVLIL